MACNDTKFSKFGLVLKNKFKKKKKKKITKHFGAECWVLIIAMNGLPYASCI